MELRIHRNPMIDYILIIIGTLFVAVSVNMFFDPLQMVNGGVTGIAIILKSMSRHIIPGGIPIYISNIVINIPLFLLAVLIKGRNFGVRTLFATVFLSVALYITEWVPVMTQDIFLGSIFGGVLSGIGLGLVFSAYGTTGGTDLAASIIQHFFRHISLARFVFILDGAIVLIGLYIFGPEKAMYAIISIYISAKVIDGILEGLHFSKAAFIISTKQERIAIEIMEILDRGVTGLKGQGKYTMDNKEILLCVVSKRQIVKLKEIVRKIDEKAFVIVTDVREVFGEGFAEYENSENKSS